MNPYVILTIIIVLVIFDIVLTAYYYMVNKDDIETIRRDISDNYNQAVRNHNSNHFESVKSKTRIEKLEDENLLLITEINKLRKKIEPKGKTRKKKNKESQQ